MQSKLDYGCILYWSARKSYLQMLDPIHNQGLTFCFGAFRTSPIDILHFAPYSMLSRSSHCLNIPHMARCLITHIRRCFMQGRMPSVHLAFALSSFLTVSNIDFSDISKTHTYFVLLPWCIKPPKIVLDLVHLKKDRIHQQFISRFSWKYQTGTVITFLYT